MRNCTRHAFTDGQCVNHGCKDCPSRARRFSTRSRLPDHIAFGFLITATITAGLMAGYTALERVERVYVAEARV